MLKSTLWFRIGCCCYIPLLLLRSIWIPFLRFKLWRTRFQLLLSSRARILLLFSIWIRLHASDLVLDEPLWWTREQKLIAALDEFVNQVRWRYCLDPRRSKEKEKKMYVDLVYVLVVMAVWDSVLNDCGLNLFAGCMNNWKCCCWNCCSDDVMLIDWSKKNGW